MHTQAGMEVAVATSKGYLTQVLCLYMIAAEIGRMRGELDVVQYAAFVENLKKLPKQLEEVLADKAVVQQLASQRFMDVNEFFLGRGMDYALMMEGSLKLKELSYIHSETYPAGRAQARPDRAHRKEYAGHGAGNAECAFGKAREQHQGGQGARRVCRGDDAEAQQRIAAKGGGCRARTAGCRRSVRADPRGGAVSAVWILYGGLPRGAMSISRATWQSRSPWSKHR